jgi:group I intron endonuclease
MTIGIYKLIHTSTKKYYIGSSTNIEARFVAHKSFFKHKKNISKLQKLYEYDPHFDLTILETCRVCDLKKKEEKYLRKSVKIDPLCVNTYRCGTAMLRNRKKSATHKTNLAMSMIGKNGKPRLQKQTTFVSPDGIHHIVTNIKQFAKKHNLSQTSLNSVANGTSVHHLGWRLSSTHISELKKPPEQFKKDMIIISPDGTKYTTKNVTEFEKQHNIKVSGYRAKIKTSAKHTKGMDEYGRGWYIEGTVSVYEFKNLYTGEIIENVIAPATLAKKVGIHPSKLRNLVTEKITRSHSGWVIPSRYLPVANQLKKKSKKNNLNVLAIIEEYEKNKKNKAGHYVQAPDRTVHYIPYLSLDKFCKQHSLQISCMSHLLQGKASYHLGWTAYIPQTSEKSNNTSESQ